VERPLRHVARVAQLYPEALHEGGALAALLEYDAPNDLRSFSAE
jgi:hypothetical protein